MQKLILTVLKDTFAICKLPSHSPIPNWLTFTNSKFVSITKTEEELSIVCDQSIIPDQLKDSSIVKNWRTIKVEGPLDFSLTGILSAMLQQMTEQKISIFALSTYDTDYLLIQEDDLARAIEVLRLQYIVND